MVREQETSEVMGQAQSDEQKVVNLKQIQELYMRFACECPSGKLHLHEFKKIFGINSQSLPEENAYADAIFESFDSNQDNTIDFMEYVIALNLMFRDNLKDKLKWFFKVYDKDGNGYLDRQEVHHIIQIVYKIKRQTPSNECMDMTPDEICDRIFELVDKNNDGQISLEEFTEGAQQDPWIMEQMRLDVRPTRWYLGRSSAHH